MFISKTFDPGSGLPDISKIEPEMVTASIATSFDIVKNKTRVVCFMLKIVFLPCVFVYFTKDILFINGLSPAMI